MMILPVIEYFECILQMGQVFGQIEVFVNTLDS